MNRFYRDKEFIAGEFLEDNSVIPDKYRFMLRYFTNTHEMMFLRYYCVFGDCRNIINWTGDPYLKSDIITRYKEIFHSIVRMYDTSEGVLDEEVMRASLLLTTGKLSKNYFIQLAIKEREDRAKARKLAAEERKAREEQEKADRAKARELAAEERKAKEEQARIRAEIREQKRIQNMNKEVESIEFVQRFPKAVDRIP